MTKAKSTTLDLDALDLDSDVETNPAIIQSAITNYSKMNVKDPKVDMAAWLLATTRERSPAEYEVFPLPLGGHANFIRTRIPFALFDKVKIVQETNQRTQELLTKESLGDILESLEEKQYLPAFVIQYADGTLELLDGLRRFSAASLLGIGLEVYLTTQNIGQDNAKILAKRMQCSREHNDRELGVNLLAQHTKGSTYAQLSVEHKKSIATIRRMILAAKIDIRFLKVLPDAHLLNHDNNNLILKIQESCLTEDLDIKNIITEVVDTVDLSKCKNVQEQMEAWINAYQKLHDSLFVIEKKKVKKVVVPKETLFGDSKTKQSITRLNKGRNVTFELKRIPNDAIERIDKFIKDEIARFEANSK